LTAEQRKKFDNFSKARQNHGQHRPSTNGPTAGGVESMLTNAAPVGP
jgi:hypothetical protein